MATPIPFRKHQSHASTKVIVTGDNGAGKSASLATLANAGYRLFIFDFDNGLDAIKAHVTDAGIDNIHSVTLKDSPGDINAFKTFKSMLWKGWIEEGVDLGNAKTWGPKDVIVIDSLTFMTDAIRYDLLATAKPARPMNDQLTMPDWGDLVRELDWQIAQLTSDTIKANLVMTSQNLGVEDSSGIEQLYPNVGTKNYAKEVAGNVNNCVAIRTRKDDTKYLRTISDRRQNLKNANSKVVPAEMDLDLAQLFSFLQTGKAA